MRHFSQLLRFGVFASMCMGICGCGDSQPKTYPVAGTLQFEDGKSVPGGTISFHCTLDGKAYVGRGRVGADGKFELTTFNEGDGVVAGEHRVTVVALPPPDSRTPPPAVFDSKYGDPDQSGLTATITPETKEVTIKIARAQKMPGKSIEK
jgi:hypothetical protein